MKGSFPIRLSFAEVTKYLEFQCKHKIQGMVPQSGEPIGTNEEGQAESRGPEHPSGGLSDRI